MKIFFGGGKKTGPTQTDSRKDRVVRKRERRLIISQVHQEEV